MAENLTAPAPIDAHQEPARTAQEPAQAPTPPDLDKPAPYAWKKTPRLNGTPIFGRIRSADIECPTCAKVCVLRQTTPGDIWNRRTGIFTCPRCHNRHALAVLYYAIASGRPFTNPTPPDMIPTVRQSLELRQQLSGSLYQRESTTQGRNLRNIALEPGCRCVATGRGVRRHPRCPVHGPDVTTAPDSGQPSGDRPMPKIGSGTSRIAARQRLREGVTAVAEGNGQPSAGSVEPEIRAPGEKWEGEF